MIDNEADRASARASMFGIISVSETSFVRNQAMRNISSTVQSKSEAIAVTLVVRVSVLVPWW